MNEIASNKLRIDKTHPNTTYKIRTLKEVYDKLDATIDSIKFEIRTNKDLDSAAKDNLIQQMNTVRHLIIDMECDWTF